jgi:hypothetical protein
MSDNDFLLKLKALCLRFDREYGGYPEHEYEGLSVYEFALGKDADFDVAEVDVGAWVEAMKQKEEEEQ